MNPFMILAAVQAVAGITSAYGQVQAGKAQKAAIREQAKQEEMDCVVFEKLGIG